jgi:hypothetical protein
MSEMQKLSTSSYFCALEDPGSRNFRPHPRTPRYFIFHVVFLLPKYEIAMNVQSIGANFRPRNKRSESAVFNFIFIPRLQRVISQLNAQKISSHRQENLVLSSASIKEYSQKSGTRHWTTIIGATFSLGRHTPSFFYCKKLIF